MKFILFFSLILNTVLMLSSNAHAKNPIDLSVVKLEICNWMQINYIHFTELNSNGSIYRHSHNVANLSGDIEFFGNCSASTPEFELLYTEYFKYDLFPLKYNEDRSSCLEGSQDYPFYARISFNQTSSNSPKLRFNKQSGHWDSKLRLCAQSSVNVEFEIASVTVEAFEVYHNNLYIKMKFLSPENKEAFSYLLLETKPKRKITFSVYPIL